MREKGNPSILQCTLVEFAMCCTLWAVGVLFGGVRWITNPESFTTYLQEASINQSFYRRPVSQSGTYLFHLQVPSRSRHPYAGLHPYLYLPCI